MLGVGKRGTPKPFVTACDRFIYVENLGVADAPEEAQSSRKRRPIDPQTLRLLRDALADCSDEDGWAELSDLGVALTQRKADFDTRTFGFRKLSRLLGSEPQLFEVKDMKDTKKAREKEYDARLVVSGHRGHTAKEGAVPRIIWYTCGF